MKRQAGSKSSTIFRAALLLFTLSGCALGGAGRDGIVDLEAPLEKQQKGVARLIKAVQSGEEEEKERASGMLVQYGALAVPPLIEMAEAGDLDDRLLATSLIGKAGAESREALPFLIEELEDEDEFIRLAAAEAVGWIPGTGEESIPALKRALTDASPFVRSQAAATLVSLYRPQLEASDPFLRVDTIRNLGETGSAGVPLLLEILRGDDAYLRPTAAEVLGVSGVGSAGVVEGLVEALGTGEPALDLKLLQALRKHGPDAAPALPALVTLLESGSPTLVKAAFEVIVSIGPAAQGAAADIMPFLESGDVSTSWYAAKALLDLGLRPEGAIPVFVETLKREDNTYERSREYLILLEEKALPYLQPLLGHENAAVRIRASVTIGRSGAPPDTIFGLLVKMLGDDDFFVCAEVVRVLAEVGADSPGLAIPFLLPALESGDPHLRVGAAAVLAAVDPDNSESRRVLIEGFSSRMKTVHYLVAMGLLSLGEEGVKMAVDSFPDNNARMGAVRVLGVMGEEAGQAVPALMNVTEEDDGILRVEAMRTLGNIGPGARDAVPLLVEALDDNRRYIRKAAETALRNIDPSALSRLPSHQ